MKKNLFHNKEMRICKVHIKNICLLENSGVLTTMLWKIQVIYNMTPWQMSNIWVTVLYWTAQILMTEAECLSEASVDRCQQTRPHILENLDLQTSVFEILVAAFIFMCSMTLYLSLLGNISCSLSVGRTGVSERSVRNYHNTLRSITEESVSQLTTWRRGVEIPFSYLLRSLMLKMEVSSSFEGLVTLPW